MSNGTVNKCDRTGQDRTGQNVQPLVQNVASINLIFISMVADADQMTRW